MNLSEQEKRDRAVALGDARSREKLERYETALRRIVEVPNNTPSNVTALSAIISIAKVALGQR